MILPACLNIVTDGAPLLTLWRLGPDAHFGPWDLPAAITITTPGLEVAARFLLRVLTCVTLAFLLVATTGPDELLNGLRRLGMPRAFAMVLTMMHRYTVVLLRAAQEIHLAKLSRSMGAVSLSGEQRWVATGMGSLFRRTRHLADEVHEAMLSRGYDGDLQVAAPARWRLRDGLLVNAALLLSAALLLADRLL
jgi:cobalt/nickel transport system permease protein